LHRELNVRRRHALIVMALPLAGALASCGGGDYDPPVCNEFLCLPDGPVAEMAWDAAQYTISPSATSTEPVTVDAVLLVHGYGVFAGLTIEVTPNGPAANPSCDGRYQTAQADPQDVNRFYVPVRFVVRAADGPGSYPKGRFTFTANIPALTQEVAVSTVVLVQ
jgi:hypothetical protein